MINTFINTLLNVLVLLLPFSYNFIHCWYTDNLQLLLDLTNSDLAQYRVTTTLISHPTDGCKHNLRQLAEGRRGAQLREGRQQHPPGGAAGQYYTPLILLPDIHFGWPDLNIRNWYICLWYSPLCLWGKANREMIKGKKKNKFTSPDSFSHRKASLKVNNSVASIIYLYIQ